MNNKLLIAVLILFAFLLRVYNITRTTEFLGDQGRDLLVVRELVLEKKLPVVGPTVGAGHYTGPFYYYLIAPSVVLFKDNPVAPSIELSIISVAAILLFLNVATSLFGFPIAYGVSLLWALSPLMIIQDRRLWNPTSIPFFVLLLIASLVWIVKDKKYWAFLTAPFAAAVLIQLHYVNSISLLLAGICFIGIVYWLVKQGKGKTMLPWLIAGIGIFVLLLYPFILYEAQRGFKDITGSFMTLSYAEGQLFSKRLYITTFIDICSRLISYIVTLPWKIPLIIITACILVANLLKKKLIPYLLVIWFCVGIAFLSLYKDTFQPQYAYQFIPIVFLLLGGVLQSIRKLTWPLIFVLVMLITVASWFFNNPYKTNDPDIPRIAALTDAVVLMADDKPFAFTVMNSRSFTDFHVRYFLLRKDAQVVPIDDSNNQTLFILCEQGCPDVTLIKKVSVMCHTEVCPLDMPIIERKDWTYVSTKQVGTSAIYIYKR
jgi:hypothetical protein